MSGDYTVSGISREHEYINGNVQIRNSGIPITKLPLRIGVPERYEFPDVLEIKITNKCIHSCVGCHEGSKECGENKILPTLYEKLSKLPDLAYTFIISGGCILENLQGFYDLCRYLTTRFSVCTICVKINVLDLGRINDLPGTFGKHLTNAFLDYPGYYCISMDKCGNKELQEIIEKLDDKVGRFRWGHNTLWRFDHTIFPFDVVKAFMKTESRIRVIVEGGKGELDQKESIKNYLEEQRLHFYNKPPLLFDQDSYRQLGLDDFLLPSEKQVYSIGWDNYVYIDATKGTYRRSRLGENTDWTNLEILEYYGQDTHSK